MALLIFEGIQMPADRLVVQDVEPNTTDTALMTLRIKSDFSDGVITYKSWTYTLNYNQNSSIVNLLIVFYARLACVKNSIYQGMPSLSDA